MDWVKGGGGLQYLVKSQSLNSQSRLNQNRRSIHKHIHVNLSLATLFDVNFALVIVTVCIQVSEFNHANLRKRNPL